MNRGDIWWADLPEPSASEPGFKRPVVVLQADEFNKSRIDTVVVVMLTSNGRLAAAPGNVRLSKAKTGLRKDSVANVSQIATLDKTDLVEKIGQLDRVALRQVSQGVELVLGLV